VLFGTPQPTLKHWKQLNNDALADLLTDCLAEKPSERPQNFQIVLNGLGGGSPEKKSPPRPTTQRQQQSATTPSLRDRAQSSEPESELREKYLLKRTASERENDIALVTGPTKEEVLFGGSVGLLISVVFMIIYWDIYLDMTSAKSRLLTIAGIIGYLGMMLVGFVRLGYGIGVLSKRNRYFGFREPGMEKYAREKSFAVNLGFVFFFVGIGAFLLCSPKFFDRDMPLFLLMFGVITLTLTTFEGVVQGLSWGWKRQARADVKGPLSPEQIPQPRKIMPVKTMTVAIIASVGLLIALARHSMNSVPLDGDIQPVQIKK